MTSKTNKIILFLTFLLLNGVVTGCDSCKSEKEKLEQEEKLLIEKLKKQARRDEWAEIKTELLDKHKGNKQEIDEKILKTTQLLEIIGEIEKGSTISEEEKSDVLVIIEDLKQTSADQKQNLTLIKEFATDALALLKNFKKQAELKK